MDPFDARTASRRPAAGENRDLPGERAKQVAERQDEISRSHTRRSVGWQYGPAFRRTQLPVSSFLPLALAAACCLIGASCSSRTPAPTPEGPVELREVTRQTGISFRHTDGSSGRRFIVEPMSAGLALFDYDGDGRTDVYFLNGSALPGSRYDVPPTNALWRNEGNWRFTDVTGRAGVGDKGFGLGVTVGDYDNDGDSDLYLNNFGPNVLYRNNGDGTFTDVTETAGVANGNLVGAGTCFLDMDADGDLDLYVANYLEFDFEMNVDRTVDGMPSYPSPRDYVAVPDSLFLNNGDGTFTDVSLQRGVATCAGTGMGMVCADYDNDGDTDVFVLNDVAANFFFINDGRGYFEESAMVVGSGYNAFGDENGSMGVDCGDYDNDGLLDFIMTSYQAESPVLYRNVGDGLLEDVTSLTGAGASCVPYVNWGTGFADFDNDGDRDIFIANGHTEDNIDLRDNSTAYRAPNVVLINTGGGNYIDVSSRAGDGLLPLRASRGTAFDDLDNDGDVDVVILNSRQEPTILRNESKNQNHWIQIRTRGVHANRDGVGARVTVVAGDLVQIAEVHSGRGYQSHWGSRLHFGLGMRDRVDRIEVRWLGGGEDVFRNLPVDRLAIVTEGRSELRFPHERP